MINLITLLICFLSLSSHSIGYSSSEEIPNHDFAKMSCQELMLGLIRESSFKSKFQDKNMALEFFFERYNDRFIGLTFVRRTGEDKDGIYGNFKLDLVKKTLKIIDPNPPIPIKINKNYVPFIAEKCTRDENIYFRVHKRPDPEDED